MSRLLLISLGKLNGCILEAAARADLFDDIVIAGRSAGRAERKINLARVGAGIAGHYPRIRHVGFDLNRADAAGILAGIAPDVALAAPSLLPWWRIDEIAARQMPAVAQVPFAGWLAFHLAPMLRLRDAWVASRLRCPWIGASYPDVVNAILARTGPAPLCGVGNVDEAVPKIRWLAAELAGLAPADIDVRLVAQHAFEYFLYRDGPPPPADQLPPFLLQVTGAGRDLTALVRSRLFEPWPIAYDLDFNLWTASSAVKLFGALAGNTPRAMHLPAPEGRPGGWPVTVSAAGVRLDLPPEWSEAQALDCNLRSLPWDGIAAIEGDGSVRFTEATVARLAPILGRPLEVLRLADVWTVVEDLEAALGVRGAVPA